jgi:hypothetical protein
MAQERTSGTYDIGFGKPPKRNRFKKGESGNLKGRPRGTLNLATVLQRILREKVVLNERGHRKVVTKLEAVILKLVNEAASGNSHAVRLLCQLVVSGEERSVAIEPATQFSETDQKVLGNILKRFQQTLREGKDETDHE